MPNPNAGRLFYKGIFVDQFQNDRFQFSWLRTAKTKEANAKEISDFLKKAQKGLLEFRLASSSIEFPKLPKQKQHSFSMTTRYPGLLIGTGYSHQIGVEGEFKIGFYFDYTTGLPILPGSSVKGLLRSAFPQFKHEGENVLMIRRKTENDKVLLDITPKQMAKANYIWKTLSKIDTVQFPEKQQSLVASELNIIHWLELAIFESIDRDKSKAERDSKNNLEVVYNSIYHRDIFHDAMIEKAATNGLIFDQDYITPHTDENGKPAPLKNPTPIMFLKIRPNVTFRFGFNLTQTTIKDQIISAKTKEQLFQQILIDLGIGAKTNVGYGRLKLSK